MKISFKDGQKVLCINDEGQKVIIAGAMYTVDRSKNAPYGRVYLKEWKRYSFSKSRFVPA